MKLLIHSQTSTVDPNVENVGVVRATWYRSRKQVFSSLTIDINYGDVIMGIMVSQITSLTSVYSTVYSGADQRKHLSSASLAFVRGINRSPVNSPHKGPVTRKMFHLMTPSWYVNRVNARRHHWCLVIGSGNGLVPSGKRHSPDGGKCLPLGLCKGDCVTVSPEHTSRALMEGINMEKSSQGCFKAMQLSQ